jgi:hypothetical protein
VRGRRRLRDACSRPGTVVHRHVWIPTLIE